MKRLFAAAIILPLTGCAGLDLSGVLAVARQAEPIALASVPVIECLSDAANNPANANAPAEIIAKSCLRLYNDELRAALVETTANLLKVKRENENVGK